MALIHPFPGVPLLWERRELHTLKEAADEVAWRRLLTSQGASRRRNEMEGAIHQDDGRQGQAGPWVTGLVWPERATVH